MTNKLKNRNEVNTALTWDLSSLFQSDASMLEALSDCEKDVETMVKNYQGKLHNVDQIVSCINDWMDLIGKVTRCGTYAHLNLSVDQTNSDNTQLYSKVNSTISKGMSRLSFIESELSDCDEDVLKSVKERTIGLDVFVDDLLRQKPYRLHPEVEKTLSALAPILNAFYPIYNRSKLADLQFDDFEVNGQKHPLSFVLFENELEYTTDKDIRHEAFRSFSKQLSKYQHTMAATYQSHIHKEKLIADMRGYPSIFDYLLFNQKVTKDMYDRQIDVIMEKLAPAMQKYAKLLQRVHGLKTMTFADLKLPLDPDFEPSTTIEDAKTIIKEGLEPLGKEYIEMVDRCFDERWIDFEQNIGKSTGAFCSSPYGAHPYILISWTQRMRECFVLAHEIGHAGHFYFTHKHQNILSSRPSLYFIEAPSTMNELLVAQKLKEKASDPRMKRWILATIISRTYYHNFVTHLLEAAYQREVYKIIDNNGSIVAPILSKITIEVLTRFWGDSVKIDEEAQFTWMRQPHYYMGLYPYTYSAGLTISTQASKKIIEDPKNIEKWKAILQSGGTKDPIKLAKMIDIDLSTQQPLDDTIATIDDMIDEMIRLTDEIESSR